MLGGGGGSSESVAPIKPMSMWLSSRGLGCIFGSEKSGAWEAALSLKSELRLKKPYGSHRDMVKTPYKRILWGFYGILAKGLLNSLLIGVLTRAHIQM